MIFAVICAGFALYAANLLHKTWRDPDNWHIDAYSKKLRFHNWPLAGIAVVILICSLSVVALEFAL